MSIIDLPNELIFEIIDYLGFEGPSSLCVALTCRSLYDVVMPQIVRDEKEHIEHMIQGSGYLSVFDYSSKIPGHHRRDPDTPAEFFKTTQPPEDDLTKLVYRIRNVGRDMRYVHRLIHSSKTLDTVELQLDNFEASCMLSSTRQEKGVKNLANFIASIASRPGLSLIIKGGFDALLGSEGGPFIFKISKASNRPSCWQAVRESVLAWAIQTTFWRYFVSESKPPITPYIPSPPRSPTIPSTVVSLPRSPKYDIISQRNARPSALKGITIHTSTLFRATFYPLTLQLLSNSPISTVELQGVGLSLFDWSKILPAITIPSLTNLAIGDLPVAFQDLLDFLNRHPLISVLSFIGSNLIGVFHPPALPHLTDIAGNAEYLVPFLDNFPKYNKLASINLITTVPYGSIRGRGHAFPGDQFYPVFERVSQLPAGRFNLTVYSLEDSRIFHWVKSDAVGTRTFPSIMELAITENRLRDVAAAIVGSNYDVLSSEQEQRDLVQQFVWKVFPQLEVLWLRDAEIYHKDLHSSG